MAANEPQVNLNQRSAAFGVSDATRISGAATSSVSWYAHDMNVHSLGEGPLLLRRQNDAICWSPMCAIWWQWLSHRERNTPTPAYSMQHDNNTGLPPERLYTATAEPQMNNIVLANAQGEQGAGWSRRVNEGLALHPAATQALCIKTVPAISGSCQRGSGVDWVNMIPHRIIKPRTVAALKRLTITQFILPV